MDLNLIERLTDGIFGKALQVRRMIQRGSRDLMYLPRAEIVALGKRVEALLSPTQLRDRDVPANALHHDPNLFLCRELPPAKSLRPENLLAGSLPALGNHCLLYLVSCNLRFHLFLLLCCALIARILGAGTPSNQAKV